MSTHDLSGPGLRLDRLPRRRRVNHVMEGFAWLAAATAIAILGIVVWSVASKGWSELNLDLVTKSPIPFSLTNAPQGLANAFAGTIVIVGLATLMALPVGILVAVYLNEFAPPAIRNGVGLVLDVLAGVPAIVVGIFVFVLLVSGSGQSGIKGSFALAILMLPFVARATIEVLALVPNSLREASLGLGIPQWRTTLSIVLPRAIGGIVTGTVLAVARVAGETAPLLFTSLGNLNWSISLTQPMASLPVTIYQYAGSAFQDWVQLAWVGALLVTVGVLVINILARFALRGGR